MRIAEDGTLTLRTGSMSVGQGLETAFCQLVADRFGVPIDNVRYEQGDTDQLPFGKGNGGSGALCIGGSAVSLAVDKVIDKAKRIAAELLEAAVVDVTFDAGRFTIAGTDRSVDLATVARAAHDPAHIRPVKKAAWWKAASSTPPPCTFPNGTHICEVEIDPDTGVTEIVRYSAVEELGFVLNPLLVAGQTHGGVVQGIGQAMGEQIVHDPHSGQMLTASFMDYQMPRADDLPDFRVATREVPTKVNPLGAKGVGEAGTVGAMAAVDERGERRAGAAGHPPLRHAGDAEPGMGGDRGGARAHERTVVSHDRRRANAGSTVQPCGRGRRLRLPDWADADTAERRRGTAAGWHRGPDTARDGQPDHCAPRPWARVGARGQRARVPDAVRSGLRSNERGVSPYFPPDRLPARTCVGVTGLARGALIEIDLIARRP